VFSLARPTRRADDTVIPRFFAVLFEKVIAMNDTERSAGRPYDPSTGPSWPETEQVEPASSMPREDRDTGLDLERTVWDPEYRSRVIKQLASRASGSGNTG
jgi:hypothetical protein